MVIAAIIVGAGVILEILAVIKAPLGYQDEKGFHTGAQSADKEAGRLWVNPS